MFVDVEDFALGEDVFSKLNGSKAELPEEAELDGTGPVAKYAVDEDGGKAD